MAKKASNPAFAGFILAGFVIARALVTILLDQCLSDAEGHTFVFQTVLVFPFLMQVVFYTAQMCWDRGLENGIKVILNARSDMAPAVFYSSVVALSMYLQTLSQKFLDASTFVVLMQSTLVFVAFGERYIIGKRSSTSMWGLVMLQASFVSVYQSCAKSQKTSPAPAPNTDGQHIVLDLEKELTGIVLCMSASVCSALGNILQQRFMQSVSLDLPASVKLLYQHIIGLALMLLIAVSQPSARDSIWQNGFFYGWNQVVVLTTFCMWLSFLAASTVTAHISAMAGAMGSAVVVIAVGTYDAIFKGRPVSFVQVCCILAIACVTTLYTLEKGRLSKLSKADPSENQRKLKVQRGPDLLGWRFRSSKRKVFADSSMEV